LITETQKLLWKIVLSFMKEARFSFSITVINLRHKNYGYPLSYTVRAKCPEATAGRLRFFCDGNK